MSHRSAVRRGPPARWTSAFFACAFLLAPGAAPATDVDGIDLLLARDAATGEITLAWSGGGLVWEVRSATDGLGLSDPASVLGGGCTALWSLETPPEPLVLFVVRTHAAAPEAESCDYVDDNCDGLIDEDFKDPTGEYYVDDRNCGACVRACSATTDPPFICQLVEDCVGEAGPVCSPADPCQDAACPELCDNVDNDLDCAVDEDYRNAYGLYFTDEHCGVCQTDCTLIVYDGLPASCTWYPWWGVATLPHCSVTCTGSCVDVNGNPSDGCECCDPMPESCGDPFSIDSDCDGPDPWDPDCADWPFPLPTSSYCWSWAGPPLPVVLGCDGNAGAQGDPIVLYELDVDGDGVYDHSSGAPIIVGHTFTEEGLFRPACRVTDAADRTMHYRVEVVTDTALSAPRGCHDFYPY